MSSKTYSLSDLTQSGAIEGQVPQWNGTMWSPFTIVIPPKMTANEASAIVSPEEGVLLYITDTNSTFTNKGWWGFDGTEWVQL